MRGWEAPTEVPRLEERTVQVWWARRSDARRTPTLAWALARLLLASHLGRPSRRIALDRTCRSCGAPHGKPRLVGDDAGLQLSLSRSGDRTVVALALGGPVGVDVERVVPSLEIAPLARTALTAREAAQLASLAPAEQVAGFLIYWTRKESVVKATGDGLLVPPSSFAVSGPNGPPRLLGWPSPPSLSGRATLHGLHPGPGYVASLTTIDHPWARIRELDAGPLLARLDARPGPVGWWSAARPRWSRAGWPPGPAPASRPGR